VKPPTSSKKGKKRVRSESRVREGDAERVQADAAPPHTPLGLGGAAGAVAEVGSDADDMWEEEEEVEALVGVLPPTPDGMPAVTRTADGTLEIHVPRQRPAPEVIDLDAGDDEMPTPKRQRRMASKEEKQLANLVHRAHLLSLLGRGRMCSAACDDKALQASLLSMLPPSLKPILVRPSTRALQLGGLGALPSISALEALLRWLSQTVHQDGKAGAWPHIGAGSKSLALPALARALASGVASGAILQQLAVALLRALGVATRWVQPLVATTPRSALQASLALAAAASRQERKEALSNLGKPTADDSLCWAEAAVLETPGGGAGGGSVVGDESLASGGQGGGVRWVHLDCCLGRIDSSDVYARILTVTAGRPSAPAARWGYVCAFTPAYVADVTPRYTPVWTIAEALRGPDES